MEQCRDTGLIHADLLAHKLNPDCFYRDTLVST